MKPVEIQQDLATEFEEYSSSQVVVPKTTDRTIEILPSMEDLISEAK